MKDDEEEGYCFSLVPLQTKKRYHHTPKFRGEVIPFFLCGRQGKFRVPFFWSASGSPIWVCKENLGWECMVLVHTVHVRVYIILIRPCKCECIFILTTA